ncbi:MAG TPA: right-handed parallel beta-helix repeat-containing protein [Pyrinomonadaceae bacterium]|nr:right-handed parallel beta-helix repeat-containing protein [Pyrinomonadaceae bacterium]
MSRAIFRSLVLMTTLTACLAPSDEAAAQGRRVEANRFPGADLGAKINAADQSLGSAPGEIIVRPGGRISTQVVVSSGHTLRFTAGTYPTTTALAPILLKSGATLVGSSREDAIIVESTAPNQFTVISAYEHARRNGAADSDITVRDIQIKGANSGFHSGPQAISMGNCSRCTVDNVWVNGTRSIGVQLGGGAMLGHFARDSKIVNSLFTRVASQNIAVTNGRNILVEGNRILAPGQRGGPGSSAIDLESNDAADHLEQITIRNNHIDMRDSELDSAGNGIIVQSGSGTPHVGPVLVEGNTLIGGYNEPNRVTNKMSNGIYVIGVTMKDVTVRNNTITRTGQAGINVEGTRIYVRNNRLTDVGGGGTAGFMVGSIGQSEIVDNEFVYTGHGPVEHTIVVRGITPRSIIERNRGAGVRRQQ